MNVIKQNEATLQNNVVKSGKSTIVKVDLAEGYEYYLSAFAYCTVRDLRDGKFEVTVGADVNHYLKPSFSLAVHKAGMTGTYINFTLNIERKVVLPSEFELYAGVFKPQTNTKVTLHGPAGYSYRLLTNKVGDGVLDYEYINPVKEWTKVNDMLSIRMILTNGVSNPKLRFEYREDCLPNKVFSITRRVNSHTHGGNYRVYTESNTAAILTMVGEILIKGADPLKTTNPYVAGLCFNGETYYSKVSPTLTDNNISSSHNSAGHTLATQIIYGDIPHITMVNTGDRENVSNGRTIFKNGKYKHMEQMQPLETIEGDVVMKFDGFGKIEGPVWILLRRPESPTIWRKAKDTRVRIVGNEPLNISGGTLPSNIPKVHTDFLMGQTVIVDYVPKTGFVQTT